MSIRIAVASWIGLLAELVADWQARTRARDIVIVADRGDHFLINGSTLLKGQVITKDSGQPLAKDISEALYKHNIVFELAPEHVVTRHLMLPIKAREFVAGIVLNQMDRLSPWPAAQTVHTIDVQTHAKEAEMIDVSVLIASRSRLEEACEALAAVGLSAQYIAARADGESTAELVTIETMKPQVSTRLSYTLPQMIGAGVATMVLLSTLITIWTTYSTAEILSERDAKAVQRAALARQNHLPDDSKGLETLSLLQRAWAYKERIVPAVDLLETLTHAIPDGAYLTELRLENDNLRLVGLASDAPSLIAPLVQSEHFSNVHFFAPTTKGQNESLYKFFVETHVNKRLSKSGG